MLKIIRIVNNLNNCEQQLLKCCIPMRHLAKGLRKIEFKYVPEPINGTQPDAIEKAKKELNELTGGMQLNELQKILQPRKYNKRNRKSIELAQNERSLKPTSNNQELIETTDSTAVGKTLMGSYNLAAYVNQSDTLQQLIKMGVNLHQIERRRGLPEFVLRLRFEEDIKPILMFLNDQQVPAECFGDWITKNPLIFKENLDDLQVRINYLSAKKFSSQQIQRILTANPFWLMFSTIRIDQRLGYFQKEFHLTGDDVRFLASKAPRLITYNMMHIRKATFSIREEMDFDKDEIRLLLLSKPRLWLLKTDDLVERFAYAQQEMKLSKDMLLRVPEVLTTREFRIRERHEFLKLLGRAQYDPTKDLYVSPKDVVACSNQHFATQIAKSNLKTYELYLKTR